MVVGFLLVEASNSDYDWFGGDIVLSGDHDALGEALHICTATKDIDEDDFDSLIVVHKIESIEHVLDRAGNCQVHGIGRLAMHHVQQVDRGHRQAMAVGY